MVLKEYKLYVLRYHHQLRAKQKISEGDYNADQRKQYEILHENHDCPDPREPEINNVETYKLLVDTDNANVAVLYNNIKTILPEFDGKKRFHLYWKYSSSKLLPISNHICYVSMLSLMAEKNNNLYLIAREWNSAWLKDSANTYVAVPQDTVLVNMVAPCQSVFTALDENQLKGVKSATRTEFTTTYCAPAKDDGVKWRKEKGGKKEKGRPQLGKVKATGKQ